MKIIVNACPLNNLPTGIGRYIKSLYAQISLSYPEIDINYFDGVRLCKDMPNPPEDQSLWATAVKIAWKLPSFVPYVARVLMHKKNAVKFLKLSKGFDVYHEAGYFPFKTAENVKTVFTVHDISLKTLPDFHPKERVRFFNKYFEKSLQYADVLITPSEFTRNELAKIYPESTLPVHPVPLGYDPDVFYPRKIHETGGCLNQLNLPEKYILFVGTSDPRKNIQTMVRAMAYLPASVKLVCTGWAGWDNLSGLGEKDAHMLKNRVLLTGYVSDRDLACLYSGARAFVYPSVYEGFGLPILEAMACGCPVVCANRASLPEVAGDAALYCAPDDPECFGDRLNKLLADVGLREKMQMKSIAQAEKFSWAKTAEKTIKVFSDIV